MQSFFQGLIFFYSGTLVSVFYVSILISKDCILDVVLCFRDAGISQKLQIVVLPNSLRT